MGTKAQVEISQEQRTKASAAVTFEGPTVGTPEASPTKTALPSRFLVTRSAPVALPGFIGELRPGKVLEQRHHDPKSWDLLTGRYAKALGLEPMEG